MESNIKCRIGGERPFFESHDLRLENVIIRAGESAIKGAATSKPFCRFEGNYPFWHVHGFVSGLNYSFDVGGRSALWHFPNQAKINECHALMRPKMFREMHDIEIA